MTRYNELNHLAGKMTVNQQTVFEVLVNWPGSTVHEIAQRAGLFRLGTGKDLHKLCDYGLASYSPNDDEAYIWFLTEKGRKFAAHCAVPELVATMVNLTNWTVHAAKQSNLRWHPMCQKPERSLSSLYSLKAQRPDRITCKRCQTYKRHL